MKKHLLFISIMLIISLVFIGCRDLNISKENKDVTIEDYYPFLEDNILQYEGIGNEFAEQETFFEFIDGNRAQLKVFNPGTTMITILKKSEGELKEIYNEAEFYYSENMIDSHNEDEEVNILLKEPLKKGTSWVVGDDYKRVITGMNVEIELPYGKLEALEVTTELDEDVREFDYYVKDIGHVASIYKDGDFEVKTILKKIEERPYNIETKFYYPSVEDKEVRYIETNMEISTNKNIKEVFESKFRDPEVENLIPVISEDTKIHSIELDRGSRIVKIDFSKELLTYIEENNSLEDKILQSIVNTLGNYYGVEKVCISINSVSFKSNDCFTINKDGIRKQNMTK